MTNLRERGKARRIQRILDAAAHIIEAGGIDSLSMQTLAEQAEVSVSTLYNLVGGKDAILLRLLSVTVDNLEMTAPNAGADPVAALGSLVDEFVDSFRARQSLYRPLLLSLEGQPILGQGSDELRLRTMTIVETAVADAVAAGQLEDVVPPAVTAHHICLAAQMGLRRWSIGMTDIEEFRAEVRSGLWLTLLAVATPATRDRLLGELAALAPAITEIASSTLVVTASPTLPAEAPS
ncbi:MAG: hypothetical protein JJLCMIEE_03618 [Acidimicrobiales bacterium]|nr:MAG: TetR/AcrR family transcriptional regulator [Actinomycetota bacterium]MBV6510462.1 hypothetical protein [Acidimicrobiales bacterium]RIK02489.1 MAG: hypothetical protein DCC48_18175 [Acidobacteriota bacterium]